MKHTHTYIYIYNKIDWCIRFGSQHPELQALGPAFVKLGQAAACREDILSEAVAKELRKLCDQVGGMDFPWGNLKSYVFLGACL